jgi:hypothetical protein
VGGLLLILFVLWESSDFNILVCSTVFLMHQRCLRRRCRRHNISKLCKEAVPAALAKATRVQIAAHVPVIVTASTTTRMNIVTRIT